MLALLTALAAAAAPPALALPLRCTIGADCLIQKLVDLDPGPGRRDYHCGELTTDGHDGVDIRLRTLADMARGVAVLAAADGEVARVRDGEPDGNARLQGFREGRDAGNAVVIDHEGGWQTQYSHLRRGSIAVRPGQHVRAGDPIGLLGMSGDTEYPHVHFTVRHDGQAVDPFGGRAGAGCSAAGRTIWAPATAAKLAYAPVAIVAVGFAPARPDRDQARAGGYDGHPLSRAAPIVMWADAMGVRIGDHYRVTISAPGGAAVFQSETAVDSGGLSWFGFAGRRPPAGGWPAGRYRGRYEIVRQGVAVAAREGETVID